MTATRGEADDVDALMGGVEAGLGRWLVCVLAALSLTGITAVVYAFGVFFDPIQETFGITSGRVSLLFSVHTFVSFAFGAVVGFAADRIRGDLLLVAGVLPWVAGIVWTSLADSYLGVMVAFGVLVAFGFGITYIVIYATLARWFDRRLGLAMSILSVGFGLGGLVGPPVAEALLSYVTWAEAYLVLGGPTTVVILATAVSFRTARGRGWESATGPAGDPASGDPTPAGVEMSFRETFASLRFWVVTTGFTLGFYAFYAILVHYVPYVVSNGVSRPTAALGLGLVGGASIPARLLAGHLSDRYGRVSVLLVGYVLVTLATLGMILGSGSAPFLVLALLFGLGSGATSALYSPIVADVFGDADIGKMLGLTSVAFGIAGVAGPYLTGVLAEGTGSYALALLVAAASSVAGATLIALSYSERLDGRTVF